MHSRWGKRWIAKKKKGKRREIDKGDGANLHQLSRPSTVRHVLHPCMQAEFEKQKRIYREMSIASGRKKACSNTVVGQKRSG